MVSDSLVCVLSLIQIKEKLSRNAISKVPGRTGQISKDFEMQPFFENGHDIYFFNLCFILCGDNMFLLVN